MNLRPTHREVLQLFRRFGPLHDRALYECAANEGSRQSESGLRTRRSELVEEGLVRDSGRRETLAATPRLRTAIIWELTPEPNTA